MQYLRRFKNVLKENVTSINFRFLEIKDDGSWVIKKEDTDDDKEIGYYKFLIRKEELQELLDSEDPKRALYEHFAVEYHRRFMEFLMLVVCVDSVFIASIEIDYDQEYSYLESEYMQETYLNDSINNIYSEEIGMLSDFDYYPYGLYKEVRIPLDGMLQDSFKTTKISKQQYEICTKILVDEKTLQAVGDEYGLTKESIRQTVNNYVKKLSDSIIEFKRELRSKIDELGLYYVETIPIEDQELKSFFVRLVSHEKSDYEINYDENMDALYLKKSLSHTNILETISQNIPQEQIFKQDDMKEFLKETFPSVKNIDRLFNKLFELKDIKELEGMYIFSFLYPKKREMIDFYFSLHSSGVLIPKDSHKVAEYLNKLFPTTFEEKDIKRGIQTAVTSSENIVLWDRGLYIHKNHLKEILVDADFSDVVDYLDSIVTDHQIDLHSCYEKFRDFLEPLNIQTKNSLYTILELKYPDRYSYLHRAWIGKKGVKKEELSDTILKVMSRGQIYSIEEMMNIFHTNRDIIVQLLDRVDEVEKIDTAQYKIKDT